MRTLCLLTICLLLPVAASADGEEATALRPHLTQYGEGDGPTQEGGVHHLLDDARSTGQSNAVGFDRVVEGAYEQVRLKCRLRVLEGGDGGAFLFLDTRHYGTRGPAPFLESWVEPNLTSTFAVGIDVHNPPSEEMFTPWGNYQDLPQREVSLHWDGREVVKRVAPEEFRGDFAPVDILLDHVDGGAEVTVRIGEGTVYDRYFVAGIVPYEMRPAIGAGTRDDATTTFDVEAVEFLAQEAATPRRRPLHVEVFNHVLTDNAKTAFTAEVDLPPPEWAFSRVIMTIDIHDAGKDWDEWDRNGEVSVVTDDGEKLGIVPFITSYRTECHWEVDVTHFRPWLSGKRTIEIAAGTTFYKNRGYMMSLSLDFHHGTPALEPFRIDPLWVGQARYKSSENHYRDFFEPREVAIDEQAAAGRVFTTTTGHSQVGEFTPCERTIVFAPAGDGEGAAEHRYEDRLWKADCYLNPNRPQFGTWQFSRAGWAPGDVVRPWTIDLSEHLRPGTVAEFRYEPQPYEFDPFRPRPSEKELGAASQVVRAYLVQYREAGTTVPAPVLRVANVAADSNAAEAGMTTGDYLVSYDGRRIDSVDDLREAIQAVAAAERETVVVVVYRGSERHELTLSPGRMGVNLDNR